MALKYLHDKHILHRDLKTANVFLTSKNVVKLGDFGISTVLQNTMACAKTVCGTPYYFSPELCQSKPYNNKSDVWALGVVLYEMLTLSRPFQAKSLKELMKKILVGAYDPLPQSTPAEMQVLCASLLNINPVHRPSVNRILESPYVQEALKGFSNELQEQTNREKAELDEKLKNQPPPAPAPVKAPGAPAPQPTAPAPQPKLSEKEQMAMMRGMGRDGLKAMLQQGPSADIQAEIARQKAGGGQPSASSPASPSQYDGAPPDDEDAAGFIHQKQVILQQAKGYVGKAQIGGHEEEFGDAPANQGPQTETIVMANGQSVPAPEVRRQLEAEMGSPLLNRAVEFVSDLLSGVHAPSNAEIQRELNGLVGARYAHHSPAIAKLAMFEGKIL
jgi:NIMA (never in mitosis gene a)-related kinase